jgi:hypothetical protein
VILKANLEKTDRKNLEIMINGLSCYQILNPPPPVPKINSRCFKNMYVKVKEKN